MAQICNKLIVKLIYLFHAYLHFNRQQINIFIPLSTFLLRQEEKVSEGKTWDPSIKCKCWYIFQPFPSLRRLHCTAVERSEMMSTAVETSTLAHWHSTALILMIGFLIWGGRLGVLVSARNVTIFIAGTWHSTWETGGAVMRNFNFCLFIISLHGGVPRVPGRLSVEECSGCKIINVPVILEHQIRWESE